MVDWLFIVQYQYALILYSVLCPFSTILAREFYIHQGLILVANHFIYSHDLDIFIQQKYFKEKFDVSYSWGVKWVKVHP